MTPSATEPAPGTATPSGWPSGRPPLQTMPPLPSGTPVEVPPERWQAILDHLAGQGVTGTPELVSAEAVTWPDSSLGCPSPGVSYTQALVDGLRVVVRVAERQYDFRIAGTELKLCPSR
ncbi:MAG: hypothetical protein QM804_14420 [Propionicimonas sp.]